MLARILNGDRGTMMIEFGLLSALLGASSLVALATAI